MGRVQVVGLTRISERWSERGDAFSLACHVELQRQDEPGGEAFRVRIVSPKLLHEALVSEARPEPGRGYLFCTDFDERVVRDWLQGFVERAATDDWHALQRYVERYFDWI